MCISSLLAVFMNQMTLLDHPQCLCRMCLSCNMAMHGILVVLLSGVLSTGLGQKECKMTTLGMEYFGGVAVTVSGRRCQSWSSQFPQQHKFNNTLKNSKNYCRNPDREPQGPWCYTLDEEKRWEYCRIPLCSLSNDECYEKGKGYMYTGKMNVTKTGYPCRRWDSEEAYGFFEELGNFCRSPDGAKFPWCLSTAPDTRWERCNIAVCGQLDTAKSTTAVKPPSKPSTTTTKPTSKAALPVNCNAALQAGNQERSSSSREALRADLVIAILTLVCVIIVVSIGVYIAIVLRNKQYLPQTGIAGKALYSVDNAYDIGYTDMQPIVHSQTVWLGFYKFKPYLVPPSPLLKGGKAHSLEYSVSVTSPQENCALVNHHPHASIMLTWTYYKILIFGIVFLSFAECMTTTTGKLECKLSVLGKEYRGKLNVTRNGRLCQAWSIKTPHTHRFSNALRNSKNYCRNPDLESEGPWCYTTDKRVRWEYCDIPKCDLTDATCYEKGFSAYYSGKVNITQSGILCARWDSDEFYQDFSEEENYCRDLDGAGFPWCLSSAPGVRWERCNIYTCNELGCPDGWTRALQLNSCYKVDRQSVNWTEAVEGCQKKFSNLTSIHNHKEELFVAALIAGDSKSRFWTGKVKSKTNESKWLNDTSTTYSDSRLNSSNGFKYPSITFNTDTQEVIWFANIGNEKLQGFVCKRNMTGIRRHSRRTCDKYFEEKCYSTHKMKVDVMSAERYCQEKYGGHLASIKNWLNNIFLTDDLPTAYDGFWIGAIPSLMNKKRNVAKWTNGETYQYSNWTDATKRILLDSTNVHSYFTFLTLNGSWGIATNRSTRGFICESKWDAGNVKQTQDFGNSPLNFQYHDAVHWCKNGWRPFRGKCYMVLKEERNWEDGRRTCHSERSALLSPKHTSEVLFLRSIFTDTYALEAWIENMPLKINDEKYSGGSYHVTRNRNFTRLKDTGCMVVTSNGTIGMRNCTDMKLTICEMRSNGCGEAPEIPNSQQPIRGSYYPAGTTLVYKCNSGFISRNDQLFVQCAVNLTWTGPKNSCHENCYRPGEPYYGNFSTTFSGKICKRWSSRFSHRNKYSRWTNAWENYCRDYDHDQPWCYTTDTNTKWENCNVSKCADLTELISTTVNPLTTFSKPEHTFQTTMWNSHVTTKTPLVQRNLPGTSNFGNGYQDELHTRITTDLVISILTLISVFVILVFALYIICHLRRKQQLNVPVEQTSPPTNGDVIYMVETSNTQYTSSTDLRPMIESSS
ncbi:uncharacterized protein LOC125653240 [Ostrea edulis]|uniref:uncharacterized protein LOC125653240 n=1 Tax=Ostrea edulis TaxID=37623 RepID=UPI0024AF5D93|nr:uncharacterized protein LOC125653240 [Ostrea edulis]